MPDNPQSSPGPSEGHHAVVLVADIAGASLPESAASDQDSKMHQKLDEIVFLFDGRVTDPLSPLLIAEMPDARRVMNGSGSRSRRERRDGSHSRAVDPLEMSGLQRLAIEGGSPLSS